MALYYEATSSSPTAPVLGDAKLLLPLRLWTMTLPRFEHIEVIVIRLLNVRKGYILNLTTANRLSTSVTVTIGYIDSFCPKKDFHTLKIIGYSDTFANPTSVTVTEYLCTSRLRNFFDFHLLNQRRRRRRNRRQYRRRRRCAVVGAVVAYRVSRSPLAALKTYQTSNN